MAGKQAYNQMCPIASVLDVIGSRWALLVVRELSLGPRRFGDIHAGLETASTDMVTSRLRELENTGLVERTDDRRYRLTDAGLALGPMMRQMVIWSLRTETITRDGATGSTRSFGPDPVRRVVGLLGLIARTTPVDGSYEAIRLSIDQLTVEVSQGVIGHRFYDRVPEDSAGTITMSAEALVALVIGGEPLEGLLATNQIATSTEVATRVLQDLGRAVAAVHNEINEPVAPTSA